VSEPIPDGPGPDWHTFHPAATGADPHQLTRLSRFYDDVVRVHTVYEQHGGYVCQCGNIPAVCTVHRARIRHGMVRPDSLPWAASIAPEDREAAAGWWQPAGPPPSQWPNGPGDEAWRDRPLPHPHG